MNDGEWMWKLDMLNRDPEIPGIARSELPLRQLRVVDALLIEPTIAKAAKRVGVNERTVRKWMKGPAFQRALDEARREAFAESLARLLAGAGAAVEALHRVLEDERARPSDKVSAARTLLDHAHRAEEALDVRERIAALEAALASRREQLQ